MICGSGGSKSRLAKAAGAEPSGQMSDEKAHAVVARSTFRSENVQNTSASDRFWKLSCPKSARRCGANHISKSKCTKHTRCRFAWQAQGIVRLVKSEQNMRALQHFQRQPPLHHTTLQYTTLQLQLQLHLHYIPLHYTPLPYTALNYTQFHYTTLHYTTLHYTTLHYTTFKTSPLPHRVVFAKKNK